MAKIDHKIMKETRRQLRDAEIYKQSSNHIDMFKPTINQDYIVLKVGKFGGITYCEHGGKFSNEWKANVSSHIDREVLDKL